MLATAKSREREKATLLEKSRNQKFQIFVWLLPLATRDRLPFLRFVVVVAVMYVRYHQGDLQKTLTDNC
jgi:hypothetical protein